NMEKFSTHTDQVHKYLTNIFDGVPGLIEIRSIKPDSDSRNTFHESIDSAAAKIKTLEGSGRNIHVGMATRRDSSKGDQGNLASFGVLWFDWDGLTGPNGLPDTEKVEAAKKQIAKLPFQPSMLEWSGGGIQGAFRLNEAIPATIEN